MKNRVSEFGVCPICGKSDKLSLVGPDVFYRIHWKHPCSGSIVQVECHRCGLSLAEYTGYFGLETRNYNIVVGELKKKWEKLKH